MSFEDFESPEDLWSRLTTPHQLYSPYRPAVTFGRMTERKLNRMIRLGLGQGHLAAYIPWLLVRKRDSSPTSNVGHLPAPTFGHKHHYRSILERQSLLVVQFAGAWDARDQFPMWPWPHRHLGLGLPGYNSRAEVPGGCEIAQQAGITVQNFLDTRIPIVGTIDIITTWRRTDGSFFFRGHQCKPLELMQGPERWRTLERLELTRRYLNASGIEQHVVHTIDGGQCLLANLDLLRPVISRGQQQYLRNRKWYRSLVNECRRRAYDAPVMQVVREHATRTGREVAELLSALRIAIWHQDLDHDLTWPYELWLPLRPGGRALRARLQLQWSGETLQ